MFQHARRLFLVLGLAFSTALGTAAPAAQAQIPYFQNLLAASQTKYAAMVVDARSGEVLYAKHADSPRYPASITKIMTLYLAFDALSTGRLKPDDMQTHYDLGLAYASKKQWDLANEHAQVAYGLGAPFPGLKEKLIKANAWKPAAGGTSTPAVSQGGDASKQPEASLPDKNP